MIRADTPLRRHFIDYAIFAITVADCRRLFAVIFAAVDDMICRLRRLLLTLPVSVDAAAVAPCHITRWYAIRHIRVMRHYVDADSRCRSFAYDFR